MSSIPPKPWPRLMDEVERATCLLPDFDAVREALSAEPVRDEAWARFAGAVEGEPDLDATGGEPLDLSEDHDQRDRAIAEVRGQLFSPGAWFDKQVAQYTDDFGRLRLEASYPVQIFGRIEGYDLYGRWRSSVYGPEYDSWGMSITPDAQELLPSHRIPARRYASWQENVGALPWPSDSGADWQRVAFVALWGVRQHRSSAACRRGHSCCEVCDACSIEVPEFEGAGAPVYVLPIDDPAQRQSDIAAAALASDEVERLTSALLTGMKASEVRWARAAARKRGQAARGAWYEEQSRLAERTFTLVEGPSGPHWQEDAR